MEETRNGIVRTNRGRAALIAAALVVAVLAMFGVQACRLRSRSDAGAEQKVNRALVARADDGLRTLKRQTDAAAPLPIAETLANRPKTAESLLTGGPKKELAVQAALPRLTGVVWQPEKPLAIFDIHGAKGRGEDVAGYTVTDITPERVVLKDGPGKEHVLKLYGN